MVRVPALLPRIPLGLVVDHQIQSESMIDWTGKMWHIYTMEYYVAIKNDEFVSFVGTWMNLETSFSAN